jgi:asparagine synthase (glutamine-hydrolysing)
VGAAAIELGHRNFHTFSVAFAEGGRYDETAYARKVASHIGSRHHEIRIDRETFVSFLPEMVRATDEPLADLASIPLHFVSRLASKEVKAVLSGEGSDELLAGYSFDQMGRSLDRLRVIERWLPASVRQMAGRIPAGAASAWLHLWAKHGWANMLAAKPYHMTLYWDEAEKQLLWRSDRAFESTFDRLRSRYRTAAGRHPIDQVQQIYCSDWLTEDLLMKADKMSMATSLEVREPFLDHHLAEWAARLPLSWRIGDASAGYQSKKILREFCRRRLPQNILDRPKQGFPVPAYDWLAKELHRWADDLLFGQDSRLAGYLDLEPARPVLARAGTGDGLAAHKIWLLIVLEHWLQAWA